MGTDALREQIQRYLLASAETVRRTAETCRDSILDAAHIIVQGLRGGGKVLICGNGGSAAESQHLAGEFVGSLDRNYRRRPMPAVALTTDTAILTAISNDLEYAAVFERQVEALGRPGDVLLGLSTSGNSENVIRAFRQARAQSITTIALTGASGGRLKEASDLAICVPSQDVQHIQEVHLTVAHLLSSLVEQELFETRRL